MSDAAVKKFFERYHAFYDNGWAAELRPIAKDVFHVYLRHADNLTGVTTVKLSTVAKILGHADVSNVQRARAELFRFRLLTMLPTEPGRSPSVRVETPPVRPRKEIPPVETTVPVDSTGAVGLKGGGTVASTGAPPVESTVASVRTAQELPNQLPTTGRRSGGGADTRGVLTLYAAAFERRYGAGPTFTPGRDGQLAKRLLAAVAGDLKRAGDVIDRYLGDDDAFVVDRRHPFPLLLSNVDRYRISSEPTNTNSLRARAARVGAVIAGGAL